ncbi:MAG: outer membrane beta-barrel protein [Gammaproteobacteria bacterium]|nr:outer membrane beta-barrel protein [Gammaproteobacteria bacterium]
MRFNQLSLAALLLSLSTATFAMENGAYLGIQVGNSNIHAPATTTTTGTPTTASSTGVGERLYFGGQFNRYAAFEMGYTHYANATYNVTLPSGNKPQQRVNVVDLTGKAIWPLAQQFSLFAKLGVGIARTTSSGSIAKLNADGSPKSTTQTSLRPKIGIGASYDLTSRWQAELTFDRMMSGGGIKNADLISLGISYHWTDEVCGQFLC